MGINIANLLLTVWKTSYFLLLIKFFIHLMVFEKLSATINPQIWLKFLWTLGMLNTINSDFRFWCSLACVLLPLDHPGIVSFQHLHEFSSNGISILLCFCFVDYLQNDVVVSTARKPTRFIRIKVNICRICKYLLTFG